MSKSDGLQAALERELDQARSGTHQRQKSEEKRLAALRASRIRKAEQLRQLRVDTVETQFEAQRSEVQQHARDSLL